MSDIKDCLLSPCPFCGAKATHEFMEAYSTDSSYFAIKCSGCSCQMVVEDNLSDEDIAEWNRRTEATTSQTSAIAEAVVPDGWRLVPVEPTDVMMDAGLYQASHDATWADVYSSWKDMLAAAPNPPAAKPDTVEEAVKAERERQEALKDSAYVAGAKAGWNATHGVDPEAEYRSIVESRKGALTAIRARNTP